MNLQSSFLWALGALLVTVSYLKFGWQGALLVMGGIVFWMLLHFSRMVAVLKRAANAPVGHVASAVMLNAKLKPGMSVLHVTAMTRSLGSLQSPKDVQPEIFRWTDAGDSYVTCTFAGGKLTQNELTRPAADA